MSRPLREFSFTCALWILLVPVFTSCGSGGGADAPVADTGGRTISDFQYSQEDIQYGEKGTASEGMIVGGRRSSFEGKRQVAFGGEIDKKIYSAQGYEAGEWSGGKRYQAKTYEGNTDAGRLRASSRYNARGAREGSQQSNFSGRTVDTEGYNTGTAYEGSLSPLDSPESYHASRRYEQPRIIPYRDYQQMTIEETNRLLGRE